MTRVLIVVNVRLYREGLAQMLAGRGSFVVVGAESTGHDAAKRLDETTPDVVLIDMALPDLGVVAAELSRRSPRVPLVAVGVSESEVDVLASAELGITGYVTRESSAEDLVAALEGAAQGELICSRRTAGILIRRVAELAAERHRGGSIALLTHREREVATLMGEGLSNKEIAAALGIEVATVKNHVHNLLDKLHVRRRTDVARLLASTLH